MELNFDQVRKLAEKVGLEITRTTLVSPPKEDSSWGEGLSFEIVGKIKGCKCMFWDSNKHLVDNKYERGEASLKFGVFTGATSTNFLASETLPEQTFEGVEKAFLAILSSYRAQKVIAAGGFDKIWDKFKRVLMSAIANDGGEDWISCGVLPGYGKCRWTISTQETLIHLERNDKVFHTIKVDLLDCDFEATAQEVVKLLKEKKEGTIKKKKNDRPLYERLNELGVHSVVEDGKVVSLKDENDEELRIKELEELGLDPDNLGSIQPHPEGADRGGYLPEVGDAQYDENNGEWQ